MSASRSRNVSASSSHSRRTTPVPVERQTSPYPISTVSRQVDALNLNNEWPVWDGDGAPRQYSGFVDSRAPSAPIPSVTVNGSDGDGVWSGASSSSQQHLFDVQQPGRLDDVHAGSIALPYRPGDASQTLQPRQWYSQPTVKTLAHRDSSEGNQASPPHPFPVPLSMSPAGSLPGNYQSRPLPLITADDLMRGYSTEDDPSASRIPLQHHMHPFHHHLTPMPMPQPHLVQFHLPEGQASWFSEFRYDGYNSSHSSPYGLLHHLPNSPPNGFPHHAPMPTQLMPQAFIPNGACLPFEGPHGVPPFFWPSPPNMMAPSTMPSPLQTSASSPHIGRRFQPPIQNNGRQSQQLVDILPNQAQLGRRHTSGGRGGHHGNRNLTQNKQARRAQPHPEPQQPVVRSELLEKFRADPVATMKAWSLKEIAGHVVEFSTDQYGSRFIQSKIEVASTEEKQALFDEIVPEHTHRLMQDVFGNYVIQKFFDHGSEEQVKALGIAVEERALVLAKHIYGCRVVQKAIDCISVDQQSEIVNVLRPHILECIADSHANHVVQKLIHSVNPDQLSFLPDIRDNIRGLSTHPYGCRVLQRCLEHRGVREHNHLLLQAIHHHTVDLVQDQYGNYVIQFIIQRGEPLLEDRRIIISKIRDHMVPLSRQKYASNVCEEALKHAEPAVRREMIQQFIIPYQYAIGGQMFIASLVKDQFANYVLQCALRLADPDQAAALLALIKPVVAELFHTTGTTYSKSLAAFQKLIDQREAEPPRPAAVATSGSTGEPASSGVPGAGD